MRNANFSVIVTCSCYCNLLLNGYCGLLACMLALLARVVSAGLNLENFPTIVTNGNHH